MILIALRLVAFTAIVIGCVNAAAADEREHPIHVTGGITMPVRAGPSGICTVWTRLAWNRLSAWPSPRLRPGHRPNRGIRCSPSRPPSSDRGSAFNWLSKGGRAEPGPRTGVMRTPKRP
jgi:hypothetical protein